MAKFRVLADQLWHSGENRMYPQGAVVELPEGTKGKSIEPVADEPADKPARGKKAQGESDAPV